MTAGRSVQEQFSDWLEAESGRAWDRLVVRHGPLPPEARNAFYHAFSSALLTRYFGTLAAHFAGDFRERTSWAQKNVLDPALQRDTFRDIYNNSIGRQVTQEIVRTEGELALTQPFKIEEAVYQAMQSGYLILNPDTDPRVPSDPGSNFEPLRSAAESAASGALTDGSVPPFEGIPNASDSDDWHVPASFSGPKVLGDAPFTAEMKAKAAFIWQAIKEKEGSFEAAASSGGVLGALIGSTIGNFLMVGDNFEDHLGAALLNNIGARFGKALLGGLTNGNLFASLSSAWDSTLLNFGQNLAQEFQNTAIGTISSYLTLEAGEALGLEGFGAELFNTVGTKVLTRVLDNALSPVFQALDNIIPGPDLFSSAADGSFSSAIGQSIVSFLATKLGSLVVQPQTQAASILSSLGASAGSGFAGGYIGTAVSSIGGSLFGKGVGSLLVHAFKLIPGLGIFIGFILGAFIGNLFGSKKPKIPTANAEVSLQIPQAQYELGTVGAANGGSRDLARAMGLVARDTLNGLIDVVSRGDDNAKVSNATTVTTTYGHTGQQLWVRLGGMPTIFPTWSSGGTLVNVTSADEAVDKGVLWALPQTQIIGGDLFLKRALYNMIRHAEQVTSVAQLVGDLQIADDYAFYLENRAIIDAVIAEPWTSMSQAQKDFYEANEAFMTRAANRSPGRAQPDPGDNDASRLFPVARAA